MAHRLSSRLTSLLLRHHHHISAATKPLHHHYTTASTSLLTNPFLHPNLNPNPSFSVRFFATRSANRAAKPDIAARARQIQNRRLFSYALAFSGVFVLVALGLNQFQGQLVYYITPSQALEQLAEDPTDSIFRLGGLVLENSVAQIATSTEMQFVITDLLCDMVVKYKGSPPDLFREGHSAVIQGVFKPFTEDLKEKEVAALGQRTLEATAKARSLNWYFDASEVLAKHDEKYMPQEIAAALQKNRQILAEQEKEKKAVAPPDCGAATA